MKVISKTISRNEFISRKNGVIPSLIDEWIIPGYINKTGISDEYEECVGGNLKVNFKAKTCVAGEEERQKYVFNSYQSAVAKANELGLSESVIEYTGKFVYQDHNYGLIISDIIIPKKDEKGNDFASKVTDYTDFYVNIPDGKGGYYDLYDETSTVHYEYVKGRPTRKILSGGTEVKILTYTTLNKWYSFFKDYKKRFKPYNTAIEYYENKYKVKNDTNRRRFSSIDALYNSRGGDTMFNWIEKYCMPHDIDKEPEETFTAATYSATYNIPILITNSIDDLGQMSIFSSKWKGGVDYSSKTNELGTVVDRPYTKDNDGNVIYDYETYVINGNLKGYEHNKTTYENEFKSDNWTNYTSYNIDNYPEEFNTRIKKENDKYECVDTYAISPINGEILYNPDECDATETIPYVKQDFIISNGEYVEVIDGEYVVPSYVDSCYADIYLKRKKMLPVIKEGNVKYVELNDKKFYAVNDKIYFTKSSDCHGVGSEIKKAKYVLYNGELFIVNGSSVSFIGEDGNATINTVLNGYFIYNGQLYYILNNEVVIPEFTKTTEESDTDDYSEIDYASYIPITDEYKTSLGWNSVTVNSNGTVSICHKLDVKRADIVTGYTNSKLDLLRRRKVNVDELGNELPGYLDLFLITKDDGNTTSIESNLVNCSDGCLTQDTQFTLSNNVSIKGSNYNTPYNECVLDILYKVGEVSELEYQKTIKINNEDVKIYIGNYLDSIEFYHKDENGNKINTVNVSGTDSRPYLRLYEEPKDSTEVLINSDGYVIGNVGDYYDSEKVLYCDITYYIGATLKFDEDNYSYIPVDNRHKGVKYIDTITVTKLTGTFYMSDNTTFTFTYYLLKGNLSAEKLDDYNDVILTDMSYFEMQIMNCYSSNRVDEFNTDYWENNNGLISTPVFRTEYDLWASTPQNIKGDIYIDRGISAAFEKHLKLEEVHTLDALINYGNGYFKINED